MSSRAAGGLPHRRHGVGAPAFACAVLLGAALLGGCSAAASSARTASAATVGPDRTATSEGVLHTACGDDLRDGTGLDLAGVALVREDDQLIAVFTLASAPDRGATNLTVELRRADGTPLRRLGADLDRRRPVVVPAGRPPADAQPLDGAVQVHGAEVHAAYPAGVLDGLGSGWSWVASAGSGSAVDDVCPGGAARPGPPVVVP